MGYVHRAKIIVVLALAALSTAGCYNKKDEQLRALYNDQKVLIEDKERLTKELADAKQKNAELLSLLDSKDGQVKAAQDEVKTLEDRIAKLEAGGGPEEPPEPTGAEETFTVGGDVLFGPGQAKLTAGGRRELNQVIQVLKSRHAGRRIRVYGHTDSDRIRKSKWKDNLHLSGARAMEVRRYMVAQGIPAQNIETIAMGDSNPIASNSTSAGKQKNRRVEIKVITHR